MQKTVVRFAKFTALAAVVGLASGCATDTAKLDDVQKVATQATQANDTANKALATANDALRIANNAMRAANDAKACCEASKLGKKRFEEKMNK